VRPPQIQVEDFNGPRAEWLDQRLFDAGLAARYISAEYPRGLRHPNKDLWRGERFEIQDEPAPVIEVVPGLCTVHGKAVTYLHVAIRPAAFLYSELNGSSEFSKVRYSGGKFDVGGGNRVNGHILETVDFDQVGGLMTKWSGGLVVHVPASWCQATWKS